MKELGEGSVDMHRMILEKAHFLDGVVLVGEEWEALKKDTRPAAFSPWWVKDARAARVLLEELVERDDTVLVKGSRSYGLESVVEGLSSP
jgi:UDP-N-acetylmuramyl pentapeptide synthase